jgi:hypothetical protein
MATKKQIAANRRNAKKSTGPKTVEGKARSAENRMTHGLCSRQVLLKEEDPELFRQVWLGVLEELRPQGELETYLACRVAANIWRMNRVARIEAQLFNDAPIRALGEEIGIGRVFRAESAHGGNPFDKLCRYETAIDRGIHRALKELRALQAARGAQEERIGEEVGEALYGRAMEEARLQRGAPSAPAKGGFPNEPNAASGQAGQAATGDGAPPGPNGNRRGNGAGQGSPPSARAGRAAASTAPAPEPGGAAGPEMRNEADSVSHSAPARARGGNGTAGKQQGPPNGSGRPG